MNSFGNEQVAGTSLISKDSLSLPDFEDFKNILGTEENEKKIARTGRYPDFSTDKIDCVKYSKLPVSGLSNKNILRRVTFSDFNDKTLSLELLLKIVDQSIHEIGDTGLAPHEVVEVMRYQRNQMNFWNEIGLPAPLVFDLTEDWGKKGNLSILSMEYYDGMTHDWNILALGHAKKSLSSLTGFHSKDEINEHRKDLNLEEKKIITSSLDVIRMFHNYGTREFNRRLNSLRVFTPLDIEEYFVVKKANYYFRSLLNFFRNDPISEPITKNKNIEELVSTFSGLIKPFIRPFTERDKYMYSQGDEYLHHIHFNGKNGSRSSMMFDADHVMLNRPELSFAKLLGSHLLNLDYETESQYLNYAFSPGEKSQSYPVNLFASFDDIKRDYALISVFSRLCDMGKRASDSSSPSNIKFVTRGVIYNPHKVEFPHQDIIPVSLTYPSVSDSINYQKLQLDSRLRMITQQTGIFSREDRTNADRLYSFLKNYKII